MKITEIFRDDTEEKAGAEEEESNELEEGDERIGDDTMDRIPVRHVECYRNVDVVLLPIRKNKELATKVEPTPERSCMHGFPTASK